MACCVAVIGKDNSPLYIRVSNPETELYLHFTVHSSLDVVEERVNSLAKSSVGDIRELYLGLLYSSETHRVYGYATNTKVKFVIVLDVSRVQNVNENELRSMFRRIHSAYADAICNPFYIPGDQIDSTKFEAIISEILL